MPSTFATDIFSPRVPTGLWGFAVERDRPHNRDSRTHHDYQDPSSFADLDAVLTPIGKDAN